MKGWVNFAFLIVGIALVILMAVYWSKCRMKGGHMTLDYQCIKAEKIPIDLFP